MVEWTEVCVVDDLVVRVVASNLGLRAINFRLSDPIQGERNVSGSGNAGRNALGTASVRNDANPVAKETARQLQAYFAARLRRFDLTLDMLGTEFQKRVWRELEAIPYGETRSYRQIAQTIGSPLAVRAVGAANCANPIPIVIPCHRVIGAGGKLVGYGGGLPLKKRLLALEGSVALPLGYAE